MNSKVAVLCEADLGIDVDAVVRLVGAVLEAEGVVGAVTVAFVDEAVITALNERYRGAEGSTDVLSFVEESDPWPIGSGEGGGRPGSTEESLELGEIAVCLAVVRRYAEEEGADPGRQLAWTLVHGVLHLLGYDHEADEGEMREREEALLTGLGGEVCGGLITDRGG